MKNKRTLAKDNQTPRLRLGYAVANKCKSWRRFVWGQFGSSMVHMHRGLARASFERHKSRHSIHEIQFKGDVNLMAWEGAEEKIVAWLMVRVVALVLGWSVDIRPGKATATGRCKMQKEMVKSASRLARVVMVLGVRFSRSVLQVFCFLVLSVCRLNWVTAQCPKSEMKGNRNVEFRKGVYTHLEVNGLEANKTCFIQRRRTTMLRIIGNESMSRELAVRRSTEID